MYFVLTLTLNKTNTLVFISLLDETSVLFYFLMRAHSTDSMESREFDSQWTLLDCGSNSILHSQDLNDLCEWEARIYCQNLDSLCTDANQKHGDRVMAKEIEACFLWQAEREHSRLVPQELYSSPWILGRGYARSPGEGNGNPLQYSCLEKSMDREAEWAVVIQLQCVWLRD